MKRRDFLKSAAVMALVSPFVFGANRRPIPMLRIIKPNRLTEGATVALIAPASGVEAEEFEKALQNLINLGFKVKPGKYAREQRGFLAGSDEERLADLHQAFSDREVKAVWCVRGGYGATRILPYLNYNLIRRNPKILIGYSDITALHIAISQKTGLVTFHGPVAASSFSDYTKKHLINTLMNPTVPYTVEISPDNAANESSLYKTQTIRAGKCRGTLIGGNLSLLAALAGTSYALKRNLRGKILFIEDVNEPPYRIDRMLTQLKESVDLRGISGIALGVFKGGSADDAETSNPLIDVFKEQFGKLGVPVVYGLSFGHIRDQFTLPVGIKAELDTEKATLTFLESGVK